MINSLGSCPRAGVAGVFALADGPDAHSARSLYAKSLDDVDRREKFGGIDGFCRFVTANNIKHSGAGGLFDAVPEISRSLRWQEHQGRIKHPGDSIWMCE